MAKEQKSNYKGNTDAHRRGNTKYLTEKVETIAIRVPKGRKSYYQDAAASEGMSLNQFAITSMDDRISRRTGDEEESKEKPQHEMQHETGRPHKY